MKKVKQAISLLVMLALVLSVAPFAWGDSVESPIETVVYDIGETGKTGVVAQSNIFNAKTGAASETLSGTNIDAFGVKYNYYPVANSTGTATWFSFEGFKSFTVYTLNDTNRSADYTLEWSATFDGVYESLTTAVEGPQASGSRYSYAVKAATVPAEARFIRLSIVVSTDSRWNWGVKKVEFTRPAVPRATYNVGDTGVTGVESSDKMMVSKQTTQANIDYFGAEYPYYPNAANATGTAVWHSPEGFLSFAVETINPNAYTAASAKADYLLSWSKDKEIWTSLMPDDLLGAVASGGKSSYAIRATNIPEEARYIQLTVKSGANNWDWAVRKVEYTYNLEASEAPQITATSNGQSLADGGTANKDVKLAVSWVIPSWVTVTRNGGSYNTPANYVFTEDGDYVVKAVNFEGQTTFSFTIAKPTLRTVTYDIGIAGDNPGAIDGINMYKNAQVASTGMSYAYHVWTSAGTERGSAVWASPDGFYSFTVKTMNNSGYTAWATDYAFEWSADKSGWGPLTAVQVGNYETSGTSPMWIYTLRVEDIPETAKYIRVSMANGYNKGLVYVGYEVSTYTIVNYTDENGSVTANKITAAAGEEVVVTVAPEPGYRLKGVAHYSYTNSAGTEVTVPLYARQGSTVYGTAREYDDSILNVFVIQKMPAYNITITAEFIETGSEDSLTVFGTSYRENTPGLQFGSRVYRSIKKDEITYTLRNVGTILVRQDFLDSHQKPDEIGWYEWLKGFEQENAWTFVSATKLMDRCTDYVDFSLRMVGFSTAEQKERDYVAIACGEYESGTEVLYLESEASLPCSYDTAMKKSAAAEL